jgi:uncharacterized protein
LLWLEDAGMIHRINSISKPGMPLAAYEEPDSFKVYASDCGLLRKLANLPPAMITDPTANYTEFKGAMAENAVLQNLLPHCGGKPYYWLSDAKAEIEFVVQWETEAIPIEVKAEHCINGRSIVVYNEKFHPKHRFRFSFNNLQYNCGMLSCPSPLVEWIWNWLPTI